MVDRRFNRRRYDAARTITAFSARLREELDPDTLTGELLAVVEQTGLSRRRPGGGTSGRATVRDGEVACCGMR